MKLSFGKFAKDYTQNKIFLLAYKNKNHSVYSIKMPFRKFIVLTINNK